MPREFFLGGAPLYYHAQFKTYPSASRTHGASSSEPLALPAAASEVFFGDVLLYKSPFKTYPSASRTKGVSSSEPLALPAAAAAGRTPLEVAPPGNIDDDNADLSPRKVWSSGGTCGIIVVIVV